ncbi:hypothetical protein H4R18_002422 [Coemansia javaensis]|uniref:AB hydrolase-1 domain-containing protein n=1 Tax=Coemansia javaensis TaxID=2761396 RepID=A0A9W8HIH8_9FUNG|nr:hypothetical protein H4R18_002422 [Coemansia javaensis]
METLGSIDTTMPVGVVDSPIKDHLAKRGTVNVAPEGSAAPIDVYYEVYGTGPERVAFINGMSADRQMWELNVADFMALGRYQCLAYDHRGTGLSTHGVPLSSVTTTLLAADLRALMDALGWERAHIVGVSMGGMVALEFASQHPQMVQTLTLAVTNAGLAMPPLRGIASTLWAQLTRDPVERFERLCRTIYTEEYLRSPAPEGSGCDTMLELCVKHAVRRSQYTRPMSFAGFLGQVGAVFRHYVAPARLAAIGRSLPGKRILVATGDEDHMVRVSNSAYLADSIGREHVIFKVFEGTGHGMSSQVSARFVAAIDEMVTAAAAAAAPAT